jgi:hypothetical protein
MGVVAVVIGIFFVVGAFVGAVAVIALPALKNRWFRPRSRRRDRADGPDRSAHDRVNAEATRREDAQDQGRPRWPGDSDTGYPGR